MNCFEVTQWPCIIEPPPFQIADNYAKYHVRLACLSDHCSGRGGILPSATTSINIARQMVERMAIRELRVKVILRPQPGCGTPSKAARVATMAANNNRDVIIDTISIAHSRQNGFLTGFGPEVVPF